MSKLKQFFLWLWRIWFILIPGLLIFIPPLIDLGETKLLILYRYIGTIYQVTGILLAVYGVMGRLYGLQSKKIWQIIKEYFRDFPWRKSSVVNLSGSAQISIGTVCASGHGVYIPQDCSTEERLKSLEQNYLNLSSSLENLRLETRKSLFAFENNVNNEQENMKKKIQKLDDNLKKVFLKDIKVEIFGILLILIGVVYATVPELIKMIFNLYR